MTDVTDDPVLRRLREDPLVVEARLAEASNATLRCRVEAAPELTCVYKPVAGERPLWDFPPWTLARREVAAYALSEALGWQLVPPTVWRDDGPGGEGMCQLWIDEEPTSAQVAVVRPGRVPAGWREVLDAEDGAGRPVLLVHADSEQLARVAVFDIIANNADRKGGHLLTDAADRVWAIDHGVAFAAEDKLRTVLWGWSGQPIPETLLAGVEALRDRLGESLDPVDRWLEDEERRALRRRVHRLLVQRVFPGPTGRWPAIPWPVF